MTCFSCQHSTITTKPYIAGHALVQHLVCKEGITELPRDQSTCPLFSYEPGTDESEK